MRSSHIQSLQASKPAGVLGMLIFARDASIVDDDDDDVSSNRRMK